jgi:hypothetical protein
VIARDESWSPLADRRLGLLAAALAIGLFFAAWSALHQGFFARHQILDTPVYERYGDAIARGVVPYRDVQVEYPPAALPTFVLPSLVVREGDLHQYRRVFEALMALCGAAATGLVVLLLLRDAARPMRLFLGGALAAASPVALGSVVLSRYDLWPAALTAAALAALVSGRDRLALGALGLAAVAKVYPLALLPIALVWIARRSGGRAALLGLVAFIATAASCAVPFLALAPGGIWHVTVRQVTRPLQIESLGAAILLAAHRAGGLGVTVESSHGSQNLAGPGADAVGAIQSGLLLVALVAVWAWFARGPADRDRLFRASAAGVCAFVAFGKVFSPQFLIWLIPLVPLVRGKRGLAAGGLFLAAMVLTQLWFPYRYWRLAIDLDPLASWLVLARDLALLMLLAVLVSPEPVRRRARAGAGMT